MSESVIANDVSRLGYGARDVGTLLSVASDHEESCAHIVPRQNFQQSQCMWIVRAVVVRQGDLFASPRGTGDGSSKPLPRRRHGLIAGRGGGYGGAQSNQRGKHGRIVFEGRGKRSDCGIKPQNLRHAVFTSAILTSNLRPRFAIHNCADARSNIFCFRVFRLQSTLHGQAFRASPLHCG